MTHEFKLPGTAAVIGCGVIGSGWVSRLRLNGVSVRAFDPALECCRVLQEVHENAVIAWRDMGLATDSIGGLEICPSLAEAVEGVEFIQENVPERLPVKHEALLAIERDAPESALIASSTSGFRPTVLAQPLAHPGRLLVAHPFNPVYILPLVELVAGQSTDPANIEKAKKIYRALGKHPLLVRKEIDAFIADRLLEAAWREALWLVKDGIASTAEIDDAIRYGFGLRWTQMGMFEQYRIAGGEGGMPHFLKQFGDALDWPWSRLTDTPELDAELIDRISSQSDQQSGHFSIRELERIRDRNLAAILRALEENNWSAGKILASMKRTGE